MANHYKGRGEQGYPPGHQDEGNDYGRDTRGDYDTTRRRREWPLSPQRDYGDAARQSWGGARQGGGPANRVYGTGAAAATPQSFRGRGPKGYERTDDRLRELICEALTDDEHIDASGLEVQVRNHEVTLTGNVPDRRTKYAVEELVEQCGAVADINNQLRIWSPRAETSEPTPRR